MIRKKLLSISNNSATLLVQDTEAGGALRVLRRVSVAGWPDEDVSAVSEMYEKLRRARPRGLVPIHTCLVQNSFLSIVASYIADGDVTALLEEESGVGGPLDEKQVLRWLCACAMVIRQLHSLNLFFPGLSTDRLLRDHQTGGTANILLGLPQPLPVYFSQLRERRKNGVRVTLEYPPEVVAAADTVDTGSVITTADSKGGVGYHTTLSDVWCLGRLGMELLTTNGTNLASRSGSSRQLLSNMMAGEPEMRPSMDSVVQTLVASIGHVSLGRPQWPTEAASVASSPPPPPTTRTPQTSESAASPTMTKKPRSARNGGSRVTSAPPSSGAANGEEGATCSGSVKPSWTTAQPRAHLALELSSAALSLPIVSASPHAHVSRAPSSPPPLAPRKNSPLRSAKEETAPPLRTERMHRTANTTDDSWTQRARKQFEQLLHMNASPPKQRGGDAGPTSARGDRTPHHNRGPESARGRLKSPSPRRSSRGGLIDHNTRLLDEMFAERGNWRELAGASPKKGPNHRMTDDDELQREALRQTKLETVARQQEMRKHFTEWQKQIVSRLNDADNVELIEKDGVLIVVPRAAPPPTHVARSVTSNQSTWGPRPSPRIASPRRKCSSRPTASRARTPSVSGGKSGRNGARTPIASQAPSRRPVTATNLRSFTAAAPYRGTTTPQTKPPLLASVLPHSSRKVDPSRDLTGPSNGEANRTRPSEENGTPSIRLSATDVDLRSAVARTVDRIRGTLRNILRNGDVYEEAMQEVNFLVGESEETRLTTSINEVFMKRLRNLFSDDTLFYGAAPLCAQLVSLESLRTSLRNPTIKGDSH